MDNLAKFGQQAQKISREKFSRLWRNFSKPKNLKKPNKKRIKKVNLREHIKRKI